MDLEVTSIREQGDATKEYVLLKVLADCDAGYYGVADTTYLHYNKISSKLRHFYWFPSTQVKAGELIILRTGTGTNDTYTSNANVKVHRFYWGLKSAVWNNTGDAAVLFQMRTWKTTKA